MLRTIHLYGYLKEEYGHKHELDVSSIGETIRAMTANYGQDFLQDIRNGMFRIYRGEDLKTAKPFEVEEELIMNFEKDSFHIVPVIKGSKSSWVPIFIGSALIAASFIWPGPWSPYLFNVGVVLVLGGVSMMLTPVPTLDYSDKERPEERPSFIYNGPLNTIEQGGAVPIIYGRCVVGSTVIQTEMGIENI